jgi:hypothetical protein
MYSTVNYGDLRRELIWENIKCFGMRDITKSQSLMVLLCHNPVGLAVMLVPGGYPC